MINLTSCKNAEVSLSSYKPPADCETEGLQSTPCTTPSKTYWSSTNGTDITHWTNADGSINITASIPDGYYKNKTVLWSEPNLTSNNIKSGVTLFGVTGTLPSSLTACSTNGLQSTSCTAEANTYWTNLSGSANINGTSGSLTVPITAGYYNGSEITTAHDSNLISVNIKTGVSVFGVSGSLIPAYSACTDDFLNPSACSTSSNRYVTANAGSNISVWTNTLASTSITSTIPDAYYSGKSVSFTDSNLTSNHILTGINIFGVTGSVIPAYSACTDNTLNSTQCSTASNRYVTSTSGSNLILSGALSTSIPLGYYDGTKTCSISDANLTAGNIKLGVTILGITGAYAGTGIHLTSNAHHDKTNTPMQQTEETFNHAGTTGPITANLPAPYRDVPSLATDDDGYLNPGVSSSQVTFVTRGSVGTEWNSGIPRVVCGKGINSSLADKISDCFTQHSSKPSWDAGITGKISWNGSISANAGQGSWTLVSVYSNSLANGVTCDSTCREVWRDDRTGLIWSDIIGSDNWCRASGNAEPTDPLNYCNSVTNQPNFPNAQSWCAELGPSTMEEAPTSGETWSTAFYHDSKGGMGKNSPLSVRWRLPTKYDYGLAEVNGIRFVLPKMADAYGAFEWTATSMGQYNKQYALIFQTDIGALSWGSRDTNSFNIRCVGR